MTPTNRLKALSHVLSSAESTGELRLGELRYPVPSAKDATRLPTLSTGELLDWRDEGGYTNENLEWLLKKHILGQDVFLVGEPGGLYARRLIMTFCR
jgi:hypothetical protein